MAPTTVPIMELRTMSHQYGSSGRTGRIPRTCSVSTFPPDATSAEVPWSMNVLMTCGTAKSAIIATSTLMPCCSCIVPNVRRPTPSSSSRPTVIIISPSTPATSPRSIDRSARPQIVDSPKSTSAKISAGPNLIATAATCSISSIMTIRLKRPPNAEATTEAPSARLAWPFRAIW